MNKIFEGIKVVELSTHIAAPSAARLLADWGAEVIKVEPPAGDPMRVLGSLNKMPCGDDENLSFDIQNANKRHIAVDLKTEDGYAVMRHLLSTADVFITNVRTKALDRMKLTYEELTERQPGLIFAQVLGFGETGPAKDNPGYDYTAYYARGGLLGTIYEKDTSPINPITGFGDYQAGICLATGVMAALYKKLQTGEGDKVTVSLHHTAIYMTSQPLLSAQYGNQYPKTRKEALYPTINTYKTKDNRWLQICMPDYTLKYNKFVKVIGRDDLADDPRFHSTDAIAKDENNQKLISFVEAEMKKKTLQEWLGIFRRNDISCEKAYLFEEVLEDEQSWENECLRKIDYPSGNERTMVTMPIRIQSIGLPVHRITPAVGSDSKSVLCDCGYCDEEISNLIENKAVFSK